MVKLGLQIKANLENITDIKAHGEDFRWYIKLRCNSCGETTDKWLYVTPEEKVPLKTGHGEASLVIKCKLCARENILDMIEGSEAAYVAEDTNTYKTIVAFECRGVEIVDFSPRSGWAAKGEESNTPFQDVNLAEKEWVDYDEKAKKSVGIYDLEFKFVKL